MGGYGVTEKQLQGLGVSDGIRIGKAFVYEPAGARAAEDVKTDRPDVELERLQAARSRCIEELNELVERTKEKLGEEKATILKGQISFLNDPSFYPPMEALVRNESWSAETAARRIVKQVAALFESMPNEYMRERAADIRDVGGRLLTHLAGGAAVRLSDIREEVIIIAEDLSPSDTVQLDKNLVLGFATKVGGKTSHTAILANSLGIAAVLGLGEQTKEIAHGDLLVLDGGAGVCIARPTPETVAKYERMLEEERAGRSELEAYAHRAAETIDGRVFEIAANIGRPEEAEGLLARGAEGVGLFRTEFLFMDRNAAPSEDDQYDAYKRALEAMDGKPVVIRTLDIGGDKQLPYFDMPEEMNPFLGYRAIRLCLDNKELFVTQLRALLRASVHGDLKIMFPMISGMDEWRAAKRVYEEVRAQLIAEGARVADRIELGVMIEIPSAALIADRLAKEVDFFSIGTNDLVQYTVAVDRMNEKVSYLYDYFHPAVLMLIKRVIDASHAEGKWTGMCGSMAGDPLAAPLLVGLGLDEWSMSPTAIPKIKREVSRLRRDDCVKLADAALDLGTPLDVREALRSFLENV